MEKGQLTYEDLPEIYERLSADLPVEAIDRVSKNVSRKGYDTTGYGYQYHVNRMNEVLFGHWRTKHKIVAEGTSESGKGKTIYSKVIYMVIQIGNWVHENGESKFEVLMEAEGYGGHESLELSSAFKGAYTNAFKKVSAMLGVGRRAFEGTLDEDYFAAEAQEKAQEQSKPQGQTKPQGKSQGQQTKPERPATRAQQDKIRLIIYEKFEAIGKKGLTEEQKAELKQRQIQADSFRKALFIHHFDVDSGTKLTKAQAHQIIDEIDPMNEQKFEALKLEVRTDPKVIRYFNNKKEKGAA